MVTFVRKYITMKAVILAGGLGTRLRPFTEIIPKPLLPIGEKAVLEIQIENLKKYGCNEVFLATNYKSDYIENFFGDGTKYGVKLRISKEDKRLGTAGPVKLLQEHLTEPFFVMNGDIISSVNYEKFFNFACSQDSILTIGIKEIITPFAFGNIFFKGNYVTGIEEKPDLKNTILAGIYVFKPEVFEYIPQNEFYGMDTLIKQLLKDNVPISKYEIEEYWLDIGRFDDFEKIQTEYNKQFK
jgi:NDP-sugar pyrophosphorylase family protein